MNKSSLLISIALVFILSKNIFSQSIGCFTDNNLTFGDVYIGYSKTVNHLDAGAAKFRMVHNIPGNPKFIISLGLPSSLVLGSDNIPITFSNATSAYSETDSPSGRTNFNPNVPLPYKILPNKSFYIWLGGIANVPTNVIPGTYTATITLTVVKQ